MGVPLAPEDNEDLSEFSFQKFTKTYFQGNVTHQYSRRVIRQSLLPLNANGDKAVSLYSILSEYTHHKIDLQGCHCIMEDNIEIHG